MNIVITGGSRGIGLELASQALARKDSVWIVARNPNDARELAALGQRFPDTLQILEADLGRDPSQESMRELFAPLRATPIDLLINNAGVYAKGHDAQDFEQSFRVNATVPFLVTQALLPSLKKSKTPKVIQITSLMGSIGDNTSGGSYAYRSSKSALNMITKSLAVDESWATFCVIHPGWVKTRMGGSEAPTSISESAQGIWKVILNLEPKDSGCFRDFEGDELPW